MSHSSDRRYSSESFQEACEWFVEFRTDEPDEAHRRRFHAWLQESPANVAAYLDVAKVWVHTGSPDIVSKYPKQNLIADATSAQADVAVAIADATLRLRSPLAMQEVRSASRRGARLRLARMAIAASLVLCTAAAALVWWNERDVRTYSTGVGEHHFIVLRDGSMLNLNSRSRVRVHYVARERSVDLLEGQALFNVAKDPSRPFVVYSGGTQVKAVGTEFDVYRKVSGTVVTVIEGRVAVVATSESQTANRQRGSVPPAIATRMVSAGEQMTVQANAATRVATLDVSNAVNWTQGRLVFASTPLREVADEFNRYNERQIVIADAALESFEIDGIFSSTNANTLVQFLRRRPDIEVVETDERIVVRGR
jgi:transmembrane sensor